MASTGPFGSRGYSRLVGRVLAGRYTVDELIGSGAMGAIYRGRQTLLDRPVAIKVMLAHLERIEDFRMRFHREAIAASRVEHPNVVAVLDYGIEPDGMAFMVMEYLQGRDLGAVLRREGRFTAERAIDVMSQVLAALSAAHEEGIVHRDVKPENIMLVRRRDEDGWVEHVKVADFGVCALQFCDSSSASQTLRKIVVSECITGTPEYMAPEQARSVAADERSDLYSCGVILYELVTGVAPFSRESPLDTVMAHANEAPTPPSAFVEGVPPLLEQAIMWALEKEPDRRPQDARHLRNALRSIRVNGALAPAMMDELPAPRRPRMTSSMPPR